MIIVPDSQIDVVLSEPSGYPVEVSREDTREAMMAACGDAFKAIPNHLFIPKNERADRARFNTENGLWAMNRIDRYTNQGGGRTKDGKSAQGTHECTAHGFCYNWTAARNRHRAIIYPDGPKDEFRYPESAKFGSLFPSPMSLYNEANPSIWGGASIKSILNIATRRGLLPDLIQPGGIKFKHAMAGTMGVGNSNQSHGEWVPVRNMPEGWEETAEFLKPDEVYFPSDVDEAICLLLHGYAITVGRNGHCITWGMWDADRNIFPYPDSYDVTRADSYNTARGCAGGGYTVASCRSFGDKPVPDHLILAS